jgi:hypothetical protein
MRLVGDGLNLKKSRVVGNHVVESPRIVPFSLERVAETLPRLSEEAEVKGLVLEFLLRFFSCKGPVGPIEKNGGGRSKKNIKLPFSRWLRKTAISNHRKQRQLRDSHSLVSKTIWIELVFWLVSLERD